MKNVKLEFDSHSIDEIVAMQPEDKLAIIKEAIYGSDNLLKIVVKIMIVVDPEAITEIIAWVQQFKASSDS